MQLRGLGRAPARRCAAPLEASTCPAAAGRCCCDCCRTCTRRRGRPTGTGALQSCLRLPRLTPAPHTAASSQRARVSFSAAFPFLPPRLLQPISAPSSLFPPPVSLPEGDAWTLLRYYVFVFPIPCVEILVLHVEYRYVKYSSPFPSPPIPPAAVGCVCTDCFPCPVHCSAVGQLPPPFPVSPLPPVQRFVLCVRNSC